MGGDFDVYRSVVNLGQGPKLFAVDLVFRDPSKRYFDKATLRMNSWGGDPYNTARFDIEKQRLYSFSVDYRNIAYYNFLPSYADPSAANGVYFSQESFDQQRRFLSTELDLFPGRRIVPYLSYTRDWNSGSGITDFANGSNNSYAVWNNLRDKTDNFRGGVRIEMNCFHVTLEQGGTTFRDDQQVFYNLFNPGDRTTPFLGQHIGSDQPPAGLWRPRQQRLQQGALQRQPRLVDRISTASSSTAARRSTSTICRATWAISFR